MINGGPWNFDINLLILERFSGEEQPSGLEKHYGVFWIRVYDLPLKLILKIMAKQLGNIIGQYEKFDLKETNTMGKFLQIKVKVELRKPLKRGTVLKYRDRCLKIFFKYERLSIFCFIRRKIGHHIKYYEEL